MINVNVSQPNDGLGDKLRDAFIIVNDNFNELFSFIGDAVDQSELDSAIDSINTQLNTIVTNINTDLTNILNILDTKSDIGHTHLISEISGLQTILNSLVTSTTFNAQITSINSQIASINDILLDLQNQINNLQTLIDNIPPNDLQSIIDNDDTYADWAYGVVQLGKKYDGDTRQFVFETTGDDGNVSSNYVTQIIAKPDEITLNNSYAGNGNSGVRIANDIVELISNYEGVYNTKYRFFPDYIRIENQQLGTGYNYNCNFMIPFMDDGSMNRNLQFPLNDGTLATIDNITMQQASTSPNVSISSMTGKFFDVNFQGAHRAILAGSQSAIRFYINRGSTDTVSIGDGRIEAYNSSGSGAALDTGGALRFTNTSGKQTVLSAVGTASDIGISMPVNAGTLALLSDVSSSIKNANNTLYNSIVKQTVTNGITSSCPSQDAVYDYVASATASIISQISTATASMNLQQVTNIGATTSKSVEFQGGVYMNNGLPTSGKFNILKDGGKGRFLELDAMFKGDKSENYSIIKASYNHNEWFRYDDYSQNSGNGILLLDSATTNLNSFSGDDYSDLDVKANTIKLHSANSTSNSDLLVKSEGKVTINTNNNSTYYTKADFGTSSIFLQHIESEVIDMASPGIKTFSSRIYSTINIEAKKGVGINTNGYVAYLRTDNLLGDRTYQFVSATGSIPSYNTGTPTAPDATGVEGEIRADSDYIYVCLSTNHWVRCATDGSWGKKH